MIYLPLVQIAGPHAYAHSLQILRLAILRGLVKRSGELSCSFPPNLAVLKMETISRAG